MLILLLIIAAVVIWLIVDGANRDAEARAFFDERDRRRREIEREIRYADFYRRWGRP